MRNFLIGLLIVAAIPATVHANGGGAKASSTIRIKNVDGSQVAVIVDPPAVVPVDLATFRAAGGKVLNSGETASFSVKEGTHTIASAFINGNAPGVIGTRTVTLGKGKTVTFTTHGNTTAAPILTQR